MKNIPFEKKCCEELFQNFPPKLPRSQHPALAIKREVPPVLSCGQSCKHEAKMAGGPGCRKDDVTPHPQQSTSNMAEKPVQYTLEKIMEMSRVGFTWELWRWKYKINATKVWLVTMADERYAAQRPSRNSPAPRPDGPSGKSWKYLS